MTAPPREPVAITEIDRVIERLQMDIDDGGRPDMWSMQSMQECLRKARAVLAAPAPSAEPPECDELDRQGGWRRIVPSAEPPAQAATERMGTHWETCATDGGPRHYDCALRLIEQQAREIAELTRLLTDGGHTRALRAEAEHDALRECVKAADAMRAECDQVPPMVQQRNALHAYDTARAKVKP